MPGRDIAVSDPARQLVLDLPLRPALGRADFLVSACNEEAVAWIDRWPDWPGAGLVLYGPEGAGKSHLAAVWQTAAHACPAPDRWQNAELDVPQLLEDAEIRLRPGREAEEDLLHLYNATRAAGGSLLLTARQPPARWDVSLPDLASRLKALPAVAIEAPDDALLGALATKLFEDRQVTVKDDVIRYLVTRVERSFPGLQRVVEAIDRLALASGKPIGHATVRQVLASEDERGTAPYDTASDR